MAQMPVLFHKDNIISFFLGKRECTSRLGAGRGAGKICNSAIKKITASLSYSAVKLKACGYIQQ